MSVWAELIGIQESIPKKLYDKTTVLFCNGMFVEFAKLPKMLTAEPATFDKDCALAKIDRPR